MIDTIKLGIPLSEYQYRKLRKLTSKNDSWQWIKFQMTTGEMRFLRYKGLAELDQQSFHREIFWDISENYIENNSYLFLELSLPKFWYGHNIYLKYDFLEALEYLQKILEKQLHCRFCDCMEWEIFRLDLCYAWKCPSQKISKQVLNSLKKLHFPRKQPTIYEDSILFAGATYSLKFYLKYPEFLTHDRKELLKQNASLEWINSLEYEALGVLRCEATLRKKYLKRIGIYVVGHLNNGSTTFKDNDELRNNYPEVEESLELRQIIALCIIKYRDPNCKIYHNGITLECDSELYDLLYNGGVFEAPECDVEIMGHKIHYKGGGFISEYHSWAIEKLNQIVDKFVGSKRNMDNVEKVKFKLTEKYKSAKAARLLGFWALVQRLGSKEVKELYGHDIFYRSKRDLKAADISLIEPVKIIHAEDRFMKNFNLDIPSVYVVNSEDNYRDSKNILNLPIQDNDCEV